MNGGMRGEMVNSLFQAICRTGIFMICAQAIIHFRPQGSYEKYLKLLVSVMVLIQLFLPLGSFLAGVGSQETYGQLESFRMNLERSMEEARQRAEESNAMLEQMTLEEVRRRMEEQAAAEPQDGQPSVWSEEIADGLDTSPEVDLTGDDQIGQPYGVSIDLQDIAVEVGPIEQIMGN